MSEQKKLSYDILEEEFIQDTTLQDGNIANYGYSFNRIYAKWVRYKFNLDELHENGLEYQKNLFEKIVKEYLSGKRTSSYSGTISKAMVEKNIMPFDVEYNEYVEKLKKVEVMIEYVNTFILPYFQDIKWLLQSINKYNLG